MHLGHLQDLTSPDSFFKKVFIEGILLQVQRANRNGSIHGEHLIMGAQGQIEDNDFPISGSGKSSKPSIVLVHGAPSTWQP
jgi:hypothetical protein